MKEVLLSVDTGSLKVQYCFQLLVKAFIEKSVAKEPPKPVNWARPAETFDYYDYLKAEEVGTEVGKDLPKDELEQALGDQYGALMALDLVRVDGGKGGVGQSPDKTEPALLICPRVEQADDTSSNYLSKFYAEYIEIVERANTPLSPVLHQHHFPSTQPALLSNVKSSKQAPVDRKRYEASLH
ncbi:hypothetical protein DL768_009482 [Monosporascus sp. mg162]|nr:hypothetical protein DL768_009482 [Monosporascus sp. mg162]